MNRCERLLATLKGEPVDRPPFCFYELNGLDERPEVDDHYNIYTHPSWAPLIELTRQKTDRIVMRSVPFSGVPPSPLDERTAIEKWVDERGSLFTRRTVRAGKRLLTEVTRRDRDVNTVWTVEHLLKGVADLQAFLEIPPQEYIGEPEVSCVLNAEQTLGDTGIVLLDTSDPLCEAAQLFDMANYTVIAFHEPQLFSRLLDWFAQPLYHKVEALAKCLPGRLWRIYGPEYASPPYLPPRLFKTYVVAYDTPIVKTIQRYGGYARIHSHGRLKWILDDIVSTGCDALDPIEPPPQGDVSLAYVRQKYGERLVLFGNLEASDIETLPPAQFREKVRTALREGTSGQGRGFVLMPSACPYGRVLSPRALENYQVIVEEVENFS